MRAGNQQILLILAVFFGVLCALSPPTFGDSFSGFENFDAQQFLSDAKAKQVAEAAKRGALVGFIISAVLCFVLFPIDDKRLLKVLIIIAATAGGYFGAKNSAENRGASADPALKLQTHRDYQRSQQLRQAVSVMLVLIFEADFQTLQHLH